MRKEIIKLLAETNDKEYNVTKFLEESMELNELLIKRLNKGDGPNTPTDQLIIDEIGDLKIRLAILSIMFDKKKVKERERFKLEKYDGYLQEGKYSGRI
jgi:nucleoside-triphosphatase THEP1